MALGIVTTFYGSVGGVGSYVRNLVGELRKKGIITYVFSPDNVFNIIEPNYTSIRSRFRILIILLTLYNLKKNQIDIIQCHGTWYLQVACLIYKFSAIFSKRNVKVFAIKHSDLIIKSRLKLNIFQALDNKSDRIVFVSKYLRDKYEKEFGFKFKVPTHVVNPGCSEVVYTQKVIDELASILKPWTRFPLLTYIGLFEYPGKVKGLIILLEAIVLLKERYPRLLLAVAGRGSLKNQVVLAINRLGLENHIKILETVDTPYNLLKLSNLHCHISLQDSFAISVLEALCAGVPVVASRTGELPNMKIGGIVLTDPTASAISSAIVKSIESPPMIDQVKLVKQYSWERKVVELNDIMFTEYV